MYFQEDEGGLGFKAYLIFQNSCLLSYGGFSNSWSPSGLTSYGINIVKNYPSQGGVEGEGGFTIIAS